MGRDKIIELREEIKRISHLKNNMFIGKKYREKVDKLEKELSEEVLLL